MPPSLINVGVSLFITLIQENDYSFYQKKRKTLNALYYLFSPKGIINYGRGEQLQGSYRLTLGSCPGNKTCPVSLFTQQQFTLAT